MTNLKEIPAKELWRGEKYRLCARMLSSIDVYVEKLSGYDATGNPRFYIVDIEDKKELQSFVFDLARTMYLKQTPPGAESKPMQDFLTRLGKCSV